VAVRAASPEWWWARPLNRLRAWLMGWLWRGGWGGYGVADEALLDNARVAGRGGVAGGDSSG